ncbi:MAG: D-isomer specific 2-hydroxyacid dehydrogenase family protein [Micrococcales bacterium]
MVDPQLIAIEPRQFQPYVTAVESAGARVAAMSADVGALIWTDYARPHLLEQLLDENPQVKWVQLPYAGVDAFEKSIKRNIHFTSAKGSYREPVAEHALMLAMALGRKLADRVRATAWGKKFAVSLYDSKVLIVGGGGITEELIKLLAPFRAEITVIRNRVEALEGATRVLPLSNLDEELVASDFVFLACALTESTKDLFNLARFRAMNSAAYLINIARGPVVVTEDLITALNSGMIAGAALDVTDPEPLPVGHPLWQASNVLITPHTADTDAQVLRLFSIRLVENTKAYLGQGEWVGTVDSKLGY